MEHPKHQAARYRALWAPRLRRLPRAVRMVLTACVILGACGSAGAAVPWLNSDAPIRISAAPIESESHVMRLDLPAEIVADEHLQGVEARLRDGTPLNASPVLLGDSMVAVEIAIPEGVPAWPSSAAGPADLPVHVYLLPGRVAPNPLTTADRTPFGISRTRQQMMTRPFTMDQVIALQARLGMPAFVTDVASIGPDLDNHMRWPPLQQHRAHRVHISTALAIATRTTLRLGADAPQTAWFLFLNGEHIVDWRDYADTEGSIDLSAELTLPPGLHRLDLVVIRRPDEAFPELYWKHGGSPATGIPQDALVSAHTASAWQVQRQGQDMRIGAAIAQHRVYALSEHGETAAAFRVVDLSGVADGSTPNARLVVDDREQPFARTFVMRQLAFPRISLRCQDADDGSSLSYTMPPQFHWPSTMVHAQPHLTIEDVPVVLEDAGRLPLRFSIAGIPQTLVADPGMVLGIRWRAIHNADILAEDIAPVARENLSGPVLDLPLDASATRVVLELTANGVPLTVPATVRILDPGADFSGLTARGERLVLGADAAVLRLPPRPAAGDGARPRLQSIAAVRFVDEFWAVRSAPGATLDPAPWLSRHTSFDVRHLPVNERRVYDCVPELRKFAVLAEALATPGVAVLWGVGTTDLAAHHDLEEIERRLRFLIQATLAHQSLPILMTAPPLAGVSTDRSRRAALALKRLCHNLGIPVVDVYSKALADWQDREGMRHLFVAPRGGLRLTVPNDLGRHWLYELIRTTLQQTN